MQCASAYDRAVGYFRSTIFIIAWPAIREFVARDGKIRILCSQVLAAEDVSALEEGYTARVDAVLADRCIAEIRYLLREDRIREPARILAALVARRTIELKVAVFKEDQYRSASGRLFHDKVGIFRDDAGNCVMFKGSMNETWSGLSADGNLESIDVAASWMGARDAERTTTEQSYFEDLWNNRYPTLNVRSFPEVARDELKRIADPDWDGSLAEILAKSRTERPGGVREDPRGRVLQSHQAAGLASWEANDRRGILAFATGSGKTFTAITAIRQVLLTGSEVIIVVVPDRVLFLQWYAELKETTQDLDAHILRAGAGYSRWRQDLASWVSGGTHRRIVLATVKTAASDEFRAALPADQHLMLVADEVHKLGAPKNRALLDEQVFSARLGLSATPERAGDPVGTAAILDFFHGILEPRYTLADAVADGVLSPYFYRPHTVNLSASEMSDWRQLTQKIARLRAQSARGSATVGFEDRVHQLLIRRARIVKHAEAKIPLAAEVLTSEYQAGQRWLVYCEDLNQLESVSRALRASGLDCIPFHSRMEGDREETLRWLNRRGGIVVAIKCLDEGVDVPSVSHALILASSKNPREFIQRRGRVLRKASGKYLAFVHDTIVLPPKEVDDNHQRIADPISEGELARAVEFAVNAENPACATDLQRIALEMGLDWRQLITSGVEDEDN